MADDDECETCGGSGVVIGDTTDHKNDRTDDERPCECAGDDDFDDRDLDEERDMRALRFGGES